MSVQCLSFNDTELQVFRPGDEEYELSCRDCAGCEHLFKDIRESSRNCKICLEDGLIKRANFGWPVANKIYSSCSDHKSIGKSVSDLFVLNHCCDYPFN
jgi:hypothetical protein